MMMIGDRFHGRNSTAACYRLQARSWSCRPHARCGASIGGGGRGGGSGPDRCEGGSGPERGPERGPRRTAISLVVLLLRRLRLAVLVVVRPLLLLRRRRRRKLSGQPLYRCQMSAARGGRGPA